MNVFNVDVWTPNMTAFKIKLVDWGANGVWNNGGVDDVEHELTFTPTLSGWNSYHIPLASFTGLTTRAHMSQLIFSGSPAGTADVYIDNVFYSFNSVLPLNLTNFTAEWVNNNVVLNWNTTNEVNVKSFDAQKSTDGINFETISTLLANNNEKNNYSVSDNDVVSTTYYRIKMNDQDGKSTFSDIKKVNAKGNNPVSVYPNPAQNAITIKAASKFNEAKIWNAFGQLMRSIEWNDFTTLLDVSSYIPGMYFIQFENGPVVKFTKK
jgi:hypothetical protein